MEKINDVVLLEIDKIKKNPNQPRSIFNEDGIKELSDSIKNLGVLQPISVRAVENHYELIAGERRLLASKKVGFSKIPSIIVEVDENNSAILALVENIQREDLDFIEEAYAYKMLLEKHNISQKNIAIKVGKSQSSVSNKLRILNHDDEIIEKIRKFNLTERHARALLKIKNIKIKNEVISKIIKNNLNVKQTDVLISKIVNIEKKEKIVKNTKYKFKNTIYVNTVKKAYDEIVKTGINAEFKKDDFDDYTEIKIKIYK